MLRSILAATCLDPIDTWLSGTHRNKVFILVNCLEKYRSKLIRGINRDLGIAASSADEVAVHDFRVGIKRLTALYYFLNEIDNDLKAREMLKPYRPLFKSLGEIRDGHIAVNLIQDLEQPDPQGSTVLVRLLKSKIRRDYTRFQGIARSYKPLSIRMPTIRATGISERAILRQKPVILGQLLQQILTLPGNMTDTRWHKKRILLKRYHHKLDAFLYCPGHVSDDGEISRINMLEQLLGDWHDRVVTRALLQTLGGLEAHGKKTIAIMKSQDKLLLGSARIYLRKFALWHQQRRIEPR